MKLSYLIVGHTYEDVESLFSTISRYCKYCLRRVLTVEAFVKGLNDSFKVPPKCIERVQYCFDYSIMANPFESHFARFNLHEKTGDKCHYFVLWNDKTKGPVLQHKLYRYSDALYPRVYMEGQEHVFFSQFPVKLHYCKLWSLLPYHPLLKQNVVVGSQSQICFPLTLESDQLMWHAPIFLKGPDKML